LFVDIEAIYVDTIYYETGSNDVYTKYNAE